MDEITQLACPDCQTVCNVKFCLLCSPNRIVLVTVCGKCKDQRSIKLYAAINPGRWLEAATRGLTVIKYGVLP